MQRMTGTLKRIFASALLVGFGAVLVTWRPDKPFEGTSPHVTNSDIGWIFIGAGFLGAFGFNAIFRGGRFDDRNDPPGDRDRLV
jgi:hypothetical protein